MQDHSVILLAEDEEVYVVLIPPPASRSGPFSEMAAECSLEPDMEKHFGVVAQFSNKLNP
jgi:hypothetical protein